MYRGLNQQTRSRHTDLARVAENSHGGNPGRLLQIRRVAKDDIGGFAAQFQIAAFQIGPRRGLQKFAPGAARSGKGQHIDAHGHRQGGAGLGAAAGDHVEHPIRQPTFDADLRQAQQRQRGCFRRFQHHRIAHRQSRCQLPGANHQRKVPGHNGAHYPDRRAMHQPQHIRLRRCYLARHLIQGFGVIAKGAGRRTWFGLQRHVEFGAIVAHTQHRQFHRFGLNTVSDAVQHFLACGGGLPRPAAIVIGPPRRSDSAFNIRCRGTFKRG